MTDIENLVPEDETTLSPIPTTSTKPKIKISVKRSSSISMYVSSNSTQKIVAPFKFSDPLPVTKLVISELISASRRTDIPAFYMNHIMEALKKGFITVKGPYGTTSSVSLSPEHVKGIFWWSKDYHEWIQIYQSQPNLLQHFKHVFNFTLIGNSKLEPGVRTTLSQRLDQLTTLVGWFGPRAIKLRFDPITVWTENAMHSPHDPGSTEDVSHHPQRRDNLEFYPQIIEKASQLGIRQIIFAFCLGYPKVTSRMTRKGTPLVKLSHEEEKTILDHLIDLAETYDVQLQTCCGSQWIGYRKIGKSSCVDGQLFEEIYGVHLKSKKKDSGQRKECGCTTSRDIGSYDCVCPHSCNYCYAHPSD